MASLIAPNDTWQSTRKTLVELKRITGDLVEQHWLRIEMLAAELHRKKEMYEADIIRFLPRHAFQRIGSAAPFPSVPSTSMDFPTALSHKQEVA